MEKKCSFKSSVICVLVILSLVMFASCQKKVETDPNAGQQTDQTTDDTTDAEDDTAAQQDDNSDDASMDASTDTSSSDDSQTANLRDAFENVTVKFAYDSSAIMDTQIETLEQKAEWLRSNSETVTIEGHCDERGTTEYNLALGDRRAARVKSFLVNLGIDAERVTTVSYGEEKPLDSSSNERAWAKNRRAKSIVD